MPPPKNKKRNNINPNPNKGGVGVGSTNVNEAPVRSGFGDTAGRDATDVENHNVVIGGGGGGGGSRETTPGGDTSSASEPTTIRSTDGSIGEEEEVVISASLNFGQNKQVEVKTEKQKVQKPRSSNSPPREKIPKLENNEVSSPTSSSSSYGTAFEGSGGTRDSSLSSSMSSPGTVVNNNLDLSLSNTELEAKSPEKSAQEPEPQNQVIAVPVAIQESQGIKLQLPTTVTVLDVENAKVYLIGTAHFSLESQNDVRQVIQRTQPDCIFLELCFNRRSILDLDEEKLLREASDLSFAKVINTLKHAPPNQSRLQSILHLILLSLSASLTKKLGMAPGGEFRAAYQEAGKLEKRPEILFGDRSFHVTLARAIHSLSFMQKVKLGWHFLWSTDDITKEEIEKCKERDLLENMLLEMAGEFPSITEIFVTERDYFLAHNLYMVAINATGKKEDGDPPVAIVGVVGMGHVPGITKYWGTTKEDEFRRVSEYPPTKPDSTLFKLAKSTIKVSLYAFVGYGAYKILNRIDVFKRFGGYQHQLGFLKMKP